jgi:hypothetical protein
MERIQFRFRAFLEIDVDRAAIASESFDLARLRVERARASTKATPAGGGEGEDFQGGKKRWPKVKAGAKKATS